tara:strand:- start:92386 stop:93372 length:987 start_codon:yes stop_codon:yes gene_type:complete
MKLALEEAKKGDLSVYPNPKVGAVVVYKNKILSTGYHQKFGGEHAEIKAIKGLKTPTKNATLYVTLEPCAHFGKTNPCTDLISTDLFDRVVIAAKDPNPKSLRGIDIINSKNIKVEVGVCENESKNINRRFFTYFEKKRPYVILKIASTLDGFIAEMDGHSKWITNKESRKSSHRLRSSCQALLVGNNTLVKDNPSLTAHGTGENPRIIIFESEIDSILRKKVYQRDPIIIPKSKLNSNPEKNIEYILNYLYKKSYQTLLVEGGGKTISHFLDSGLFDELHIYYAPKLIGTGIPLYTGIQRIQHNFKLRIHQTKNYSNDFKITYFRDY